MIAPTPTNMANAVANAMAEAPMTGPIALRPMGNSLSYFLAAADAKCTLWIYAAGYFWSIVLLASMRVGQANKLGFTSRISNGTQDAQISSKTHRSTFPP